MSRNNKKCVCCSVEYKYCNRCNKDINLPAWKAIFHDENCKKIFNIASNYFANKITKEDAKEQFDSCDLSNRESFKPSIIKALNEVYIDGKEKEYNEEKEELNIDVEVVNEEIKNATEDINKIEEVVDSEYLTKNTISYNNFSNKKKYSSKIKSKSSVAKETEENKDM